MFCTVKGPGLFRAFFHSLTKWPSHTTVTIDDENNDNNTRNSEDCATKLVHERILLYSEQYPNYLQCQESPSISSPTITIQPCGPTTAE